MNPSPDSSKTTLPVSQEAREAAAITFEDWITTLDEDVIQGEYGYEAGEFAVYPDQWRPMFREGLTPEQAFRRALDAFSDERKREEAEEKPNG